MSGTLCCGHYIKYIGGAYNTAIIIQCVFVVKGLSGLQLAFAFICYCLYLFFLSAHALLGA